MNINSFVGENDTRNEREDSLEIHRMLDELVPDFSNNYREESDSDKAESLVDRADLDDDNALGDPIYVSLRPHRKTNTDNVGY